MNLPVTENQPPMPPRQKFQFRLRTIFILTAVVAVICSGLFSGPPSVAEFTTFSLAIATPMLLTVAMVYGRGYLRTFCIGALFPACTTVWFLFVADRDLVRRLLLESSRSWNREQDRVEVALVVGLTFAMVESAQDDAQDAVTVPAPTPDS